MVPRIFTFVALLYNIDFSANLKCPCPFHFAKRITCQKEPIETSQDIYLTYPDSCLCEIGPGCNLLPSGHIWVAVPLECRLQFLQLLTREVGPLSSLSLVLILVICATVVTFCALVFGRVVGICSDSNKKKN